MNKGSVILLLQILLACCGAMRCATAATIERIDGGSQVPVIIVARPLEYADGERFHRIASELMSAVVAFDSRGGNLLAGLSIGKTIRMRGFATLVPSKATCASACALAWLGGQRRLVSERAILGFHAAFVTEAGVTRESGAGNALVGAYLATIGLPERAIYYITMSPPETLAVLTREDAVSNGIDAEFFPDPANDRSAHTPSVTPATPEPALVVALQRELDRLGCDPGPVDGVWGPSSDRALARFARATGKGLSSTVPTFETYSAAHALGSRVCLTMTARTQPPLLADGRYVGVRGYTDPFRPSPNQSCRDLYEFAAEIRGGRVAFTSDDRRWTGWTDNAGRLTIERTGIDPPTRTYMWVRAHIRDGQAIGEMWSGYCGRGYFQMRRP